MRVGGVENDHLNLNQLIKIKEIGLLSEELPDRTSMSDQDYLLAIELLHEQRHEGVQQRLDDAAAGVDGSLDVGLTMNKIIRTSVDNEAKVDYLQGVVNSMFDIAAQIAGMKRG